MVKKHMSNKDRMAWVRSFIGKKRGRKVGGSMKNVMDYVRSFRGKKKTRGGKFPKGNATDWAQLARTSTGPMKAMYQRALKNWEKLLTNAKFKEHYGKMKGSKKGGSLEDGVNYRQLIGMYNGANNASNSVGSGAGIRGYGIRGYGRRCRGCGIRGYGIRGYGIHDVLRNIENTYDRIHGKGLTKKDLYKGGSNAQRSAFYNPNRFLQGKKRTKMALMMPDAEMTQAYRELYNNSGYGRTIPQKIENDPVVDNSRLYKTHLAGADPIRVGGGNVFKKIGRTVNKVAKTIKPSRVLGLIPHPAAQAVATGARVLGYGLTEEGSIDGRGHAPYIYH